jgi:hypothetical protein
MLLWIFGLTCAESCCRQYVGCKCGIRGPWWWAAGADGVGVLRRQRLWVS